MRGSIVHRGKNRWALVLDLGYVTDPTTGTHKRKQKWIAFHGTRKEAGEKLTELVRDSNRGELVEPTKLTVQKWLEEWLEKAVRPTRRARTCTPTYKHVIGHNLTPAFGHLKLQALKPLDIQAYPTRPFQAIGCDRAPAPRGPERRAAVGRQTGSGHTECRDPRRRLATDRADR